MTHRAVVLLIVMVAGLVIRVAAHHPMARVYDVGQTTTLEGTIERLIYRQPHSIVHVIVEGERGTVHTWAIESNSILPGGQGALRPGDRVTVSGHPGRDPGEYRLLMLELLRPSDGLSLGGKRRLTPMNCG